MLSTVIGLTLGCGSIIGLAHVVSQIIAIHYTDAPDYDPYLNRILREIEGAARERESSGGKELGRSPRTALTQVRTDDIAHRRPGV